MQNDNLHSFEAAPSTDEGEVLGLTEAQMHAEADKRYKLPREGGTYSGNEALRQRWAFVNGAKWGAAEARAPLEERIRDLERKADEWHIAYQEMRKLCLEARAENERLREALRETVLAITEDKWPAEGTLLGRASWQVSVDRWWALATPPSSTEGTNTLKANFDGCPFCGGDDSVGIHRIGRCEGTKES